MATYEFLCKKCNVRWEKQLSMQEEHIDKCSKCGEKVYSLITGGSGPPIFRGHDFPSNDLKREKDAKQYYKEADEVLPGKKEKK